MSEIHVNRAGQSLGIFSSTEVQAGLETGRFLGSDLGWRTGMEQWKPLSQWADFTIPAMVLPLPVTGEFSDGSLPSWEQKAQLGFLTAFGATVKEVLIEPDKTFRRMKETGGFLVPFLYMLLATGLGVGIGLAVQFGLQGFLGAANSQSAEVSRVLAAQGLGAGVAVVAGLIVLPIFIFIGSFVGAGIWHLSLMVLGGATKPYEATYRVYCYVGGSSALVSLVPCCGGFAAVIWKIVSGSIGLSRVHGISTGKAVAAILLPLLLCCGLCGVGFFFGYQALAGNAEFMDALHQAIPTH